MQHSLSLVCSWRGWRGVGADADTGRRCCGLSSSACGCSKDALRGGKARSRGGASRTDSCSAPPPPLTRFVVASAPISNIFLVHAVSVAFYGAVTKAPFGSQLRLLHCSSTVDHCSLERRSQSFVALAASTSPALAVARSRSPFSIVTVEHSACYCSKKPEPVRAEPCQKGP